MNILIPMAGLGMRFKEAGYTMPKPLIPVNGKPMIQAAIESLGVDGNWIFVTRRFHDLKSRLEEIRPGCTVIELDSVTDGPACTCLMAREHINTDKPLLTANVDQIMQWSADSFSRTIRNLRHDGMIVTYRTDTPKNSYAAIDDRGYVTRIAEKEVISNYSLNGIHYWKHGSDFIRSADRMIEKNLRVNGEFYIAPTYNELIQEGKKIVLYHIPAGQHHAIGTPEDLTKYENLFVR